MKRIIFISIIVLLAFVQSNAQSLPMYSQYIANPVNINPAYAGSQKDPSLTLLWREQWAGLQGSPSTKSITFEQSINDNKVGLGVQLFEDKYVNYIKRTGVNLYYNIRIPVSENGSIRMGLKAGLYNDSKSLANASAFQTGDIALANNVNNIIPLAGGGVYYEDNRFYLGVAVPDLITFSNTQSYAADKSLYQVNEVHYFIHSGYIINVNDELMVKPSVLIKSVKGAPLEMDLNTNIWLDNKIGLGVSYRTNQTVLAMVETKIQSKFKLGYAYDMPFNRPNSHEIYIRYNLKK